MTEIENKTQCGWCMKYVHRAIVMDGIGTKRAYLCLTCLHNILKEDYVLPDD